MGAVLTFLAYLPGRAVTVLHTVPTPVQIAVATIAAIVTAVVTWRVTRPLPSTD